MGLGLAPEVGIYLVALESPNECVSPNPVLWAMLEE